MPAHGHAVSATNGAADTNRPANKYPAAGGSYASASDGSVMAAPMLGPSGGSQPHSILQPYLALNFSIALQGIFPSRN